MLKQMHLCEKMLWCILTGIQSLIRLEFKQDYKETHAE
jgi:hypothetical protein